MHIVRKIVLIILISVFLLNLQFWIVRTILPQPTERKKILGYTLLMGAIVASALLVFTHTIQPLLEQYIQRGSLAYSAYIGVIGMLIAVIFVAHKQWRATFIISTLTVLAIVTGISELLFAGAGIGWVMLKASGEEILKTATSQSLSSHNTQYKSDVILYSILAGLGFAFFENLVYFIGLGSVGQFFVRSITISVLHGIFTGAIGYVLWKNSSGSFIGYLLAYALGIVLHAVYNIGLTVLPVATGLGFTIGGYFLLSYLMFKSDRLYSTK